MHTFLRLISEVPGTVWGAFVGSSLTLLGVMLSNRESRRRHLIDLKHDSDQRDRERHMSWRREIYLEAAESIVRSLTLVSRLPDIDATDDDLMAEYRGDLARISKIEVVATDKTVQAVGAFSNEFALAYLQLTFDRIPLVIRRNQINLLENQRDRASSEIERCVEMMRQLNLAGNSDPRLWKVINESLAFHRNQQENYLEELRELTVEQAKQRIALASSCFNENLRLAALLPAAVFAVRDELELPLDREGYMKSLNDKLERNKAAFDSFLEKMKHMVDNLPTDKA